MPTMDHLLWLAIGLALGFFVLPMLLGMLSRKG